METKGPISIHRKHKDIVALEVEVENDSLLIAAYGDGIVPSIILSNQETGEFLKIPFPDFEKFKIWSADLNGDSLKVCLTR
jgi:hypothetical protein